MNSSDSGASKSGTRDEINGKLIEKRRRLSVFHEDGTTTATTTNQEA